MTPHRAWTPSLVALSALLCLAACFNGTQPPAPTPSTTTSYLDLTLYTEEEMAELLAIMKADQGTFGVTLYCKGDVVDAHKLPGGRPGCSSQDCKNQWVTTPPSKVTQLCDGVVCKLNTSTWYPARCSNLLIDRCEVLLSNISVCM